MFGALLNSRGQNEVKIASPDRESLESREVFLMHTCSQTFLGFRSGRVELNTSREPLSFIHKCQEIPANSHQHEVGLNTFISDFWGARLESVL